MRQEASVKKAVQEELDELVESKGLGYRLRVGRKLKPAETEGFVWVVQPSKAGVHSEDFIGYLSATEQRIEQRLCGVRLMLVPRVLAKRVGVRRKAPLRRAA